MTDTAEAPKAPVMTDEEPDSAPPPAEEPTPPEPAAHADDGTPAAPPEGDTPPATPSNKHWYVVKVQSGRENSIKEAIERRVKIEGLDEYVGQIVIPVEKVTEMRNGKRVVRERKLYPGYLMCEVEYNDRILYLFRETSGVGDFVGAHPGDLTRAPTPMSDREVQRMLGPGHGKDGGKEEPVSPRPKWLQEGDRVR